LDGRVPGEDVGTLRRLPFYPKEKEKRNASTFEQVSKHQGNTCGGGKGGRIGGAKLGGGEIRQLVVRRQEKGKRQKASTPVLQVGQQGDKPERSSSGNSAC